MKRNDAIVHTRTLYYAADPNAGRESAPNAAAAALAELLPRGDFLLQMNLVPQFAQDGVGEIHVLLGVASSAAGKLDVLIGAFDRLFKPVSQPLKQRLDVPAAAVAGTSAFQWSSVLKLPPGSYEVRAAIATADGKRTASVIGYVDVPDLGKMRVALSGVLVKSAGGPTLKRVFGAGEAIECSVQVAHARRDRGTLAVRYLLRNGGDEIVSNGDVPRDVDVPAGTVFDQLRLALRLPDAPGRYVLTIEASEHGRSASSDVPIEVR
ncbi:MAG TPA: hypothetical protein VFZ98_07185 [Vicinamibacterales bacterium]